MISALIIAYSVPNLKRRGVWYRLLDKQPWLKREPPLVYVHVIDGSQLHRDIKELLEPRQDLPVDRAP